MAQKSRIERKTDKNETVQDEDAAKQASRLRSRIKQFAIGDAAVYDENSTADNK